MNPLMILVKIIRGFIRAERPCQQCQRFVRLLHQCCLDCQRAFGRHFRQQWQTDFLHGRFLLHLFRAVSVVSRIILAAQLHTTLDTHVAITPLFLIVVYSIIFYGFKTWLKVRNNDKRTNKETPYVPIPEGGVKISSHH